MPKDLRYALLLDLYGGLLTEKQKENLEFYYCDDLSLAEIAQDDGISRQAVRDAIKRGEQQLDAYEETLGMLRRMEQCNAALGRLDAAITAEAERLTPQARDTITQALSDCAEAVAVYY